MCMRWQNLLQLYLLWPAGLTVNVIVDSQFGVVACVVVHVCMWSFAVK